MYKMAVVGEYDSIFGFATLGLDTFAVSNPEEGRQILTNLVQEEYAVIYVTEALEEALHDEIMQYHEMPLPAIILIPGISGNTDVGVERVKDSVKKAVGSDILFSDN